MPLVRHTAFAATLAVPVAVAAVTAPAAPALADQAPRVIQATGPTNIHDRAYRNVRTTVQAGEIGGATWVVLSASGFPRSAVGRTFGAHVHTRKCGPRPDDSGPHYGNPRVPESAPLAAREIWLDFRVGPNGVGRSVAMRPWRISKGAARSIVVHAHATDRRTGDAGGRLLCTTVPFGDLRRPASRSANRPNG